jgi:type IV pilus assembly protein PilM
MMLKGKTCVGVDISDHAINAVVLSAEGRAIRLEGYSRLHINSGLVERGIIANEDKLYAAVRKVLAEFLFRSVEADNFIVGLPDNQVYLYAFEIAEKDAGNVDRIARQTAKSVFPVEIESLSVMNKIIKMSLPSRNTATARVIVAGIKSEVLSAWRRFYEKLGWRVDLFDIEPLAIYRGLNHQEIENWTIMIADIGAYTTTLSVFDSNGLAYAGAVNHAGNYLSRAVAKELVVDITVAEKIKRETHLADSGRTQGVAASHALLEGWRKIIEEIKSNIGYFETNNRKKIDFLVLAGGSSDQSGLEDFLTRQGLSCRVRLGLPLVTGTDPAREYIEAIGLARRGLFPDQFTADPFFDGTNRKGKHGPDDLTAASPDFLTATKSSLFQRISKIFRGSR